ncbi:hypothetical protein [Pseudaestuariivita atlantica]|uniref:Prepilin-type N-terminal cleavage/methylation domain-containing protein n=1 Tax=Pseudaestuariivita atlantica TaxID=1317121 RepID=A0A0L1JPU0_9RHOB|nr:hypothetical protein [Pseudaestuariivita atlantica]KNG93784.1 hypothetical protein ATO11_11455 [Pseudaestuariivita atlantica]
MTPRSGLGLFELLVALALLAMIAAGLAGSLTLAIGLFDRTSVTQDDAMLATRTRLRGWLATAAPPTRLVPFPARFIGVEDGFSFVTVSDTPFAPDATALRVAVQVTDDTLRLTATALDDTGNVMDTWTTLVPVTIPLSVSYFDETREPARWRARWTRQAALPSLVRIAPASPRDAGEDWPEFVARTVLR